MLGHGHSVVIKEVQVKKFINSLKFLSFLLIIVLLQGCTYQIKVKQADIPASQEKYEEIPLNVGLYLSKEVRDYVIVEKKMGSTFKFPIGDSITASALESLRLIFPNLTVIDNKDNVFANIDRIITIDIGRSTRVRLGRLTISTHRTDIELRCKVYDNRWNLLWKKSARGTSSGKIGAGYALLGGLIMMEVLKTKLSGIVSQSLTKALEQLNEKISTTGKEAIIKGELKKTHNLGQNNA